MHRPPEPGNSTTQTERGPPSVGTQAPEPEKWRLTSRRTAKGNAVGGALQGPWGLGGRGWTQSPARSDQALGKPAGLFGHGPPGAPPGSARLRKQ